MQLRKIIGLPLMVLTLAGLTGCAIRPIDLSYQMNTATKITQVSSSNSIRVAKISDLRNTDPRFITFIHYVVANKSFTASGEVTYLAQQKITTVLRQALNTTLAKSGYKLNATHAELNLNAIIKDINYQRHDTLLGGTVTGNLIVRFDLVNARTHKLVWKRTVMGTGKVKQSFLGDSDVPNSQVKRSFNLAMNSLMQRLVNNNSFVAATR